MGLDAIFHAMDSTPMFGDSYVRRPIASLSTRRATPPRPPRPELNPWPKDESVTDVLEISAESPELAPSHLTDDSMIAIKPSDIHSEQDPGRVSPLSEEAASAAGSCRNTITPSSSLNKKSEERPDFARRRFSFESTHTTVSCYSQEGLKSRGERSEMPSRLADYTDIAMANPFAVQDEPAKPLPLSPFDYGPLAGYKIDQVDEVAENEAKTASTPSTASLARPRSTVAVPMSRYNSQESQQQQSSCREQRAPPCSLELAQDDLNVSEPEKTLEEAWAEVKKAVAPKLKVAMPFEESCDEAGRGAGGPPPPHSADRTLASDCNSDGNIRSMSPASALPSEVEAERVVVMPSPPPVPARNPRRLTVGVSRNPDVASSHATPDHPRQTRPRSQSSSSSNIASIYGHAYGYGYGYGYGYAQKGAHEGARAAVPPVLSLPSEALMMSPGAAHDSHHFSTRPRPGTQPVSPPTPAASDYSNSASPPSPTSAYGLVTACQPSHEHSYVARLSFVPKPLITPPPSVSPSSLRFSMGQLSSSEASTLVSEQPSERSSLTTPRTRGFHEPPPVAPPAPGANSARNPSAHTQAPLHKMTRSEGSNAFAQPPIWTGDAMGETTFTTEIWAAGPPKTESAPLFRVATLKNMLPSESAIRSAVVPPTRSRTAAQPPSRPPRLEASVSRTSSNAIAEEPKDEFAPVRTVALPAGFKASSADDYLPKFSNNFAGFCKCAWRLQTSQTSKAFVLRSLTMKSELAHATTTTTKITTLKCKKCNFEGPLEKLPANSSAVHLHYPACTDMTPHTQHGVVYRWSFLFKSHVPSKKTVRKDETLDPYEQAFACVFCCAEGKGTVCFQGAKTLCGHIARCHPMGVNSVEGEKGERTGGGERELRMRVAIVVGRRPEKNEGWDIILPGRRARDERAVQKWL